MASLGAGRIAAVGLAATTADVLWSIGVFVGVPALLFVVLVVRELRALRSRRRRWAAEDKALSEEGYPPRPPVDDE
jgi:hypothetical protein